MGNLSNHHGLVAFGKAVLAGVAFAVLLGGPQATFAQLPGPGRDIEPGITALPPC